MSRRPILSGVLIGLLLAAMLAPWTGAALGALAAARAARAAAVVVAAAPAAAPDIVRPDLAFPRAGAAQALRKRVEQLAHGGGVLIEAMAPAPGPAQLVLLDLRISGPEKAVLALADAVERERPMARFRAWRIEPAEGGGVRLRGVLVGAVR